MRSAFIATVLASTLALAGPAAAFGPKFKPMHHGHHHHHHMKKPVAKSHGAKPGYPVYATFCAAGSLIFDAWYVGHTQHRELTSEEALGITATCFFPPLALYYLAKHAN